MQKNKQPGYILVLTMMIISAMTFLVTRLVTRASANIRVNRMVLEREQAKELALSGIKIVQAQLMYMQPEKQQEQEKEQKQFIQKLMKTINRWQTFDLKEKPDGIDGQVGVYVTVEDGKIPLNALWDFEKKKIVTQKDFDVRKLLDNVVLKRSGKKQTEKKVAEELEKIFKDRKQPLEDVSELFTNTYFKGLASTLFPALPSDVKQKVGPALGDIFTVAHDELKIQPLFFSASVQDIFELKKLPDDVQKREEVVKTLAEKIKNTIEWQKEWDGMLDKIYGKPYSKVLPAFRVLFNSTIGATTISVLSYGKMGNVTQKVYAILQRVVLPNKRVAYAVRKLYWI